MVTPAPNVTLNSNEDKDQLFERFVRELPPETEALAREFKAFTFGRKIKTPLQLLHVVFLYSGLDKSLRETAANFTLLYEKITDSSIHERLRACQPWLKAVLRQMLPTLDESAPEDLHWWICDGSEIKALASEGVEYRLHAAINLRTLEIEQIQITDRYTGESLLMYEFVQGDVIVADKGYFHYRQICGVVDKSADVLIRFRPKAGQFYRPGTTQTFDFYEVAKKYEEKGSFSLPIEFGIKSQERRLRGHLHARKIPEEKANAARRKLGQKARNKKRNWTPSKEARCLAGWVILFTTLEPKLVSAKTIFKVYQCRWQIELVFKRWKSQLKLEPLRVRLGSQLAEVWLLGKFLYALVLDKKVRRLMPEESPAMKEGRRSTSWRLWKIVQEQVRAVVIAVECWKEENMLDALEVLQERKRKRSLQSLPKELFSPLQRDPNQHPLSRVM